MAKTVAIGIQDFGDLIKKNLFYIDKTMFIKEWWESGDNTTLITRPRRFGKTLNMSMVEQFFSIDYADRGDVFEGFAIWEDDEYRQLQGTYPVISLTFARVKENKAENAKEQIRNIIKRVYKEYIFLKESDVLTEDDKDYFNSILSDTASEVAITISLNQLSDFLYRYYGKKVIIFLDEYDTPVQEAYVNGYWHELVSFTRSLFNSTFKTNPYMERALMTGITRVSKESILSDLNHLEVVTTTSNKYETYFGFTEKEVFDAVDMFGYTEQKDKVKLWYDGFVFGKYKDIYNPWSILNFLDKGQIAAYWANTSANSLVGKLIREGDSGIKEKLELLLKGQTIKEQIDEQIVYNQLDNNETAVWSLLVASGYMKVLSVEVGGIYGTKRIYELAITNIETLQMFEGMVSNWFESVNSSYNGFIKALLCNDIKSMNAYMNHVTLSCFSYFDTGNGIVSLGPERFYHGFVLGLLVELQEEYIVTSNRESGFGRYDVMIEPRDIKHKNAFILEFKVHDEEDEKTLRETVEAALKQIEIKQYSTQLEAKGIASEHIYKYGIAFQGKKVLIG